MAAKLNKLKTTKLYILKVDYIEAITKKVNLEKKTKSESEMIQILICIRFLKI